MVLKRWSRSRRCLMGKWRYVLKTTINKRNNLWLQGPPPVGLLCMCLLSILISPTQGAMKKFDENQDGLIDWDEFMAIMAESEANWVQSLFKEFDANKDGTITGEEMKAMTEKMIAEGNAAKAKIMKEMFDFVLLNFDCDGDGNISVEEFTTAMKSMQF